MDIYTLRVRLQNLVVERNVPMKMLAEGIGISRLTLHNFLVQGLTPQYRTHMKIEAFLAKLDEEFEDKKSDKDE